MYSHIVGNGKNTSSRSNAHTLDWDGNAWFAGDVYVGSTSGVNKDSGSKKLATEEYISTKYYTKDELLELLELITVEDIDNICSVTLEPEPEIFSEGLEYVLNSDNASYTLKGIGDCTDTDIVIPSTYNKLPVTSIGNSVFSGCISLTSVDIPNSVTSIGNSAFYNCKSLTSITIPDSVTQIGNQAFSYCNNLTSINIQNGVTKLGTQAFMNCSALTSIHIPSSVTKIGTQCLQGCSALTSITVDPGNSFYHSSNNCLIETSSNILISGCNNSIVPDGITQIGGQAFNGCSGLTTIFIPDSVTSIGNGAFYGCSSLTSVTIPEGVLYIETTTFYGCSSLTSVTIPSSVTHINYNAFNGCSSLTSITIPSSVISIGSVFTNCTSLKDIYVGWANGAVTGAPWGAGSDTTIHYSN